MRQTHAKLSLFLLICSTGVIYQLPYIKNIFYLPLMEAFSLSHLEMGMLSSAYSLFSLFSYCLGLRLPGGYARNTLLSMAFLSTGVLGLCMACARTFSALLVLFALPGISTILPYFMASLNMEQFLRRELLPAAPLQSASCIRAVVSLFLGVLCVGAFLLQSPFGTALPSVFFIYAVSCLFFGALLRAFLPRGCPAESERTAGFSSNFSFLIKKPAFWHWSLVIGCAFSSYTLTGILPAILVFQYDFSTGESLLLGLLRYGLAAVSGYAAVFLHRRKTSPVFLLRLGFLGTFAGFALLALPFPFTQTGVLVTVVFSVLCLSIYGQREFYYLLHDSDFFSPVPLTFVIGGISIFCYIPEIVFNPLLGFLLDRGDYTLIFVAGMLFSALGLLLLPLRAGRSREASRSDR